MNYKNQLVLTGEINDVGNPIMVNVDKSYRRGVELQTGIVMTRNLQWLANATFSQNKIENFTEYVDNWDTGDRNHLTWEPPTLLFHPT
jgi:iron complex outermembrane recepter protein